MEQDSILRSEWTAIEDELKQTSSPLSSDLEEQYLSVSQKRLIYNNLIELILSGMGVPVLGIYLLLIDDAGVLPWWVKLLLWFTAFLALYPSVRLFRNIHYPNHTLSVRQYLRSLVKRMHYYKVYQVIVAFFSSFVIIELAFLVSAGFKATVDGTLYTGILNFPPEIKWKYVLAVSAINLVFSCFVAAWGYLMYVLFYKRRRAELNAKLSLFAED